MNIETLRSRISGDVVAPEDANWDEARRAWNLAVDQRPALVALPESADDVVAIVEYARANGHRVAPQGTGHNAGPLGPMPDTVLVKTERMRGVEVDPERSVARAEAGVLWIEVTQAADEHGLAALAGSSPDVGVVGYTLGGGVSWLGRKYGLSANSVTAIELVTTLEPWEARHMYLNFSDERKDVRRLFPFDVYRRLAVAKARWDVGELFRSNHPIPPATIVSRRPRRSLVRRAPGRAARPVRAAR